RWQFAIEVGQRRVDGRAEPLIGEHDSRAGMPEDVGILRRREAGVEGYENCPSGWTRILNLKDRCDVGQYRRDAITMAYSKFATERSGQACDSVGVLAM